MPSDAAPYAHRYHVGNVGDVLKHLALVALLEARGGRPLRYLETHAGAGRYKLAASGEWTSGVGRLFDAVDAAQAETAPALVTRYVECITRVGIWKTRSKVYPGSPNLAQALSGPDDRLELYEIADEACATLRDKLGDDPRVTIHQRDGLAALPERLAELDEEADPVVLVDPPYSDRAEWRSAADAVAQAHRTRPAATIALWYPVVSLSRPNALVDALQRRGVGASLVELVTTPLELKRRALNGSGLILVSPPPALVASLLGALPFVAHACASEPGRWSLRALAW